MDQDSTNHHEKERKRKFTAAAIYLIITLLAGSYFAHAEAMISTDKPAYTIGETVTLYIYNITNNSIVKITTQDNVYKLMGSTNEQELFLPQVAGVYTATIETNNIDASTTFIVTDQPQIDQTAPEAPIEPLSNNQPASSNFSGTIRIRNYQRADQQTEYTTTALGQNNSNIDPSQFDTLPANEKFTLEIRPTSNIINSIIIREATKSSSNNIDLGIDYVPKSKIALGFNRFILKSFAIDPTNISFKNATINATAWGTELWKCKDWQFAIQTCAGSWVKIMDLTPGMDYLINIDSNDPGFSETSPSIGTPDAGNVINIANINYNNGNYASTQANDNVFWAAGTNNNFIQQLDPNGYLNLTYNITQINITSISQLYLIQANISYCHSSDVTAPTTCTATLSGVGINVTNVEIYDYTDKNYDTIGLLGPSNGTKGNKTYNISSNISNYINNSMINIRYQVQVNITTNGRDAVLAIDYAPLILSLDKIAPAVYFSSPTYNTSVFVNWNSILINTTASDARLLNLTTTTYNSSGFMINSSYTNNTNQYLNISSLNEGIYYFNSTACDRSFNCNSTETRNATIDMTYPSVNFSSSTDNSGAYVNRQYVQVYASANDTNLNNITIRIYNSSGFYNASTTTAGSIFMNQSALREGLYFFNSTACDKAGNCNSTQTWNATVDTIKPSVIFAYPTENSSTFVNRPYLQVNISSNDTNLQNTTIYVYNTSGLYNKTNTSSNSLFFNQTNLQDGIYYINSTACDKAGNCNSTETRNITVDTTVPAIRNITDFPDPVNFSTTINFTANVTDNNGVNTVLIQINNINYSMTPSTGSIYYYSLFNTAISPGLYYYIIFANDSASNLALNSSSSLNFTIQDLVRPSLNISGPMNDTFTNATAVQFYYNVSDNVATNSCTLTINNNVVNSSTNNPSGYTLNLSANLSYDAQYYWNITCNDTSNNKNTSATLQITRDAQSPSVILNNPLNNLKTKLTSFQFNYTPIDFNLRNCTLWGNWSGAWSSNQTNSSPASGSPNIFNTTTLQDGAFIWNVVCFDRSGNSDSAPANFLLTVDTAPPSWSNAMTSPASGAPYAPGASYQFNVSWFDIGSGINTTIFEANFTGASANFTPNRIGNISTYTANNLAVGTYQYRWYANDTASNLNQTSTFSYTIVQAVPTLNLSLNGTEGNITVDINSTLNITGNISAPAESYLELYLNGTLINSGYGTITSTITFHSQKNYNLTLIYYSTQNYTSGTRTYFVRVKDSTAPNVSLNEPEDNVYIGNNITFNFTPNDNNEITTCTLLLDGQNNISINGAMNATNNISIQNISEGVHNWTVNCSDWSNNTYAPRARNFTVDLTVPTIFTLLSPGFGAFISTGSPTYSWNPTTETNFANYTVEVSSDSMFSGINYSLSTTAIGDTNVVQTPPLSDGIWYWRVIAYDLAGHSLTVHPNFTVDTTPPSSFDLVSPPDGTEARNSTPLLIWQQSADQNFANYTIQASTSPNFTWVNLTTAAYNITRVNATLNLSANRTWYWRVIAYDLANLSTISLSTFSYLPDYVNPIITLMSPAANATINSSSVSFLYNVSDIGSINNCSLFISGVQDKIVYDPQTNIVSTIDSNLDSGIYQWYIQCYDYAGNSANSTTRNVTVNWTKPTGVYYETSGGAANYSSLARINLSLTKDNQENRVNFSVASGTLAIAVNASYNVNGSNYIITNKTRIDFRGTFSQSNANAFFVTWKIFKVNASGSSLICQRGNDGTGGAAVGTVAKKNLTGNCNWTGGDMLVSNGDKFTLVIDMWNNAGVARMFTHFWDNTSPSYVSIPAFPIGSLTASFINDTDPQPTEDTSFIEQCNITCTGGYCLDTEIYMQTWNGSQWKNVSNTGNITLNESQQNPISIGNINASVLANFSLFANIYSYNNTLRCYALSDYATNSSQKNISVIDRTPPSVTLSAPAQGAVTDPQSITFQYIPDDLHLNNCSLWGNFTGSWSTNQTNSSPSNGATNSFTPIYLSYGSYIWNVLCWDTAGNNAFASGNRTLIIGGDLAIASSDIKFSINSPVDGQSITITANISNNANRTEPAVVVQFWDGPPNIGTQIGSDKTISLAPLSHNTTNVTWIATIGLHNIYVLVDPPYGSGLIFESDEANNLANKTTLTSAWQIFYGNMAANVTLETADNATISSWNLTDKTGNLFFSDTDTTNGIDFSSLMALGRNTTNSSNANTLDDFAEVDSLLSLSNASLIPDNVNATFTNGGAPKSTATFNVFGRNITNVPIVNSTDVNFITGILWDMNDSKNGYYDSTDKEDLIFITLINRSNGIYGPVDYEIRIPAPLKDYKPTSSTVTLYYELK
jgi:hypothetical protein